MTVEHRTRIIFPSGDVRKSKRENIVAERAPQRARPHCNDMRCAIGEGGAAADTHRIRTKIYAGGARTGSNTANNTRPPMKPPI